MPAAKPPDSVDAFLAARDHPGEGRVIGVSLSPAHTMSKQPQPWVRLLAGLGVKGDVHAGEKVRHRYHVRKDPARPNRCQVHLIQAELHDELRAAGFEVAAGQMGENVTTRGLDLLRLPTGTRLRLGEAAVIEVTGLRTPCRLLDGIRPGLMAATREKVRNRVYFKAGIMAVVVAGGDVRPGDAIRVELPPEPHRPLQPI
jgi:MOSC domain-containing protein YiiM